MFIRSSIDSGKGKLLLTGFLLILVTLMLNGCMGYIPRVPPVVKIIEPPFLTCYKAKEIPTDDEPLFITEVHFEALVYHPYGKAVKGKWDFCDGETADMATPVKEITEITHKYQSTGTFKVTLKAWTTTTDKPSVDDPILIAKDAVPIIIYVQTPPEKCQVIWGKNNKLLPTK